MNEHRKATRRFTGIGVLTIVTLGLTLASIPDKASAQVCGWYAIGGCFKSWDSADTRSRFLKAPVVDTDTVPNFRNGWFCVAAGPTNKSQATSWRNEFRGEGISDAYIKKGC